MRYLYLLSYLVLATWSNLTLASVVMDGTRIIFEANKNDHELIFTNKGDRPYAVQIWLDEHKDTNPENANAPFLVVPHIFQILPNSKQTARIMFIGEKLPADRESLFFLSFRQVPASTKNEIQEQEKSNNLFLIFRNTVKLFYRPSSINNAKELAGNTTKIMQLTEVVTNKNTIELTNTTGYYLSLIAAEFISNNNTHELLDEPINFAPFSTIKLAIPKNIKLNSSAKLRLTAVSDYGNYITVSKDLP